MKNLYRCHLFALCGAALLSVSAGGADAGRTEPCVSVPASLPEAIRVPATAHAVLQTSARGVQIYGCQATEAGTYAWKLIGPQASLYSRCGAGGAAVGEHFAGPTWRWSADQSEFVGNGPSAIKASAPSDPKGAIPWLLVPKKSASNAGLLSRVAFVQRVNTSGGVAPADGCSLATAGAKVSVEYSADYIFYAGQQP